MCNCNKCQGIPQYYDCDYTNSVESSNNSGIIGSASNISTEALTCLETEDGTPLNEVLTLIDQMLCTNIPVVDWESLDYSCITETPYSTQIEFVEGISDVLCIAITDITSIEGSITTINNNINSILNPAITGCAFTGITNLSTYSQIMQALSTGVCTLHTRTDISSVNWNLCNVVSPTPTTIGAGFTALISQICALSTAVDAIILPTFDNTGSCLPVPVTSTDTLVQTINKIKTRLCSIEIVDIDDLDFGCVTSDTTLAGSIQNILDSVSTLSDTAITQFNSSQFTLNYVDNTNPCLGRRLELNAAINDRKVASNNTDPTPGTLIDKLLAGPNITIDDITTPGKVIISASGSTDTFVKADSSDSTTSYLIDKLITVPTTEIDLQVDIDTTTDPSSHKVRITPVVNWEALTEKILYTIIDTAVLKQIYCNIDCSSSGTTSSCFPVTNFSVEYTAPDFVIGYGMPLGGTPLGFTVQHRLKGSSSWLSSSTSPSNPQPVSPGSGIVISGLTPGSIYQFRVLTLCPGGLTTSSSIIEKMAFISYSPTIQESNTDISFNFGSNPDITTFFVVLKDNMNNIIAQQQSNGPGFSFLFGGLTPNTDYNPEYYYSYILNGVLTYSNDPTQYGSNYLLSTVTTLP